MTETIFITQDWEITEDPAVAAMVKVIDDNGRVTFGIRPGMAQNTFEGHEGRPGQVGGSLPRGDSGRQTGNAIDQAFARGGFTVKAIGLPHEPKVGYVVAQHPELGAVIEGAKDMPRAELKAKLKEYIKINKETLSKDGMYLGLWFNDGKLYMDVPSVIMDEEKAKKTGRDADQIAIWDIVNQREIPTGGSGKKGIDL